MSDPKGRKKASERFGERAPKQPDYHCNSRTRSLDARHPYCHRRAGAGTEHVGEGRCSKHGGNNPIKHGRRSKLPSYARHAIYGRAWVQLRDSPDLLKLDNEIAFLRAFIEEKVEESGDRRLGEDEEKRTLRALETLTTVTKAAHSMAVAWTDKRADDFMYFLGQGVADILEDVYGRDERVAIVLQRIMTLREKMR